MPRRAGRHAQAPPGARPGTPAGRAARPADGEAGRGGRRRLRGSRAVPANGTGSRAVLATGTAPRAVLVTGCSSGIGAATAAALLDAGRPVVATARRVE